MLSLDAAVASAMGVGGGGGKNATFDTSGTKQSNATFEKKSSKKGPKPNLLLQAMASKNKQKGQEAGVA